MDEAKIKEIAGVASSDTQEKLVFAQQLNGWVSIVIDGPASTTTALLGPESAHRLARRIHQIATRVERRLSAE